MLIIGLYPDRQLICSKERQLLSQSLRCHILNLISILLLQVWLLIVREPAVAFDNQLLWPVYHSQFHGTPIILSTLLASYFVVFRRDHYSAVPAKNHADFIHFTINLFDCLHHFVLATCISHVSSNVWSSTILIHERWDFGQRLISAALVILFSKSTLMY